MCGRLGPQPCRSGVVPDIDLDDIAGELGERIAAG